MSIKLVDTAVPMNEGGYPVARAKDIWFEDNTNLQEMSDGGIIGGVELTQAEYDALTYEEKKNGLEYRCTDSGRIYINDVLYGGKEPITLTYADYKVLEENNEVETDVDYVIISNESGALLSDIDTNHGSSNVSTYEVIETLKSDTDKKITEVETELKGSIENLSSNLGGKVDYKVVVENGTRYVEDIVTQDINTWLPNDNSSILINLKKTNGINYLNFQLLCNKQDSKNWSCIVNGAANELWKIRYIDGVRYIDELATMDKIANSIIREGKSVLYNLNNVDNIEVAIDIAKSGYKPIAVSLDNAGTHLWFAQGMYFNDTVCNLSLRGVTPSSATNAKCEVLVTYIKTS